MEEKFAGKTYCVGDNVLALDIMPLRFKSSDKLDAKELAMAAFADMDKSFAAEAMAGKYQIVVAGKNFGGGGKSIEGPVFALRGAGIKVAVADSFARYFLRNSINNAFPIIVCPGISDAVTTDDQLEVNLRTARIRNVTTGIELAGNPLSDTALRILSEGGLVGYAKNKLSEANLANSVAEN